MIRRLLLAALLCFGVAGSEAHELGLSLHLGDVAASSKAAAAFSTLDPATLGAGVTLSNGNLTVTGNSPADSSGAFSTIAKSAGLLYCELTFVTVTAGGTSMGLADSAATFPSVINTPSNSIILFGGGGSAGQVWMNGALQTPSVTPPANGTVIGIAVNYTTHNFGIRNITAGDNWNNNVANSPDTGGANIAALTGVSGLKVIAGIAGGTTNAVIYNPGSSAFVGAVPSGYSACH